MDEAAAASSMHLSISVYTSVGDMMNRLLTSVFPFPTHRAAADMVSVHPCFLLCLIVRGCRLATCASVAVCATVGHFCSSSLLWARCFVDMVSYTNVLIF